MKMDPALIVNALRHAPAEPTKPVAPQLIGWTDRHQWLCAHCAGRILSRGYPLAAMGCCESIWDDLPMPDCHAAIMDRQPCCGCGRSGPARRAARYQILAAHIDADVAPGYYIVDRAGDQPRITHQFATLVEAQAFVANGGRMP